MKKIRCKQFGFTVAELLLILLVIALLGLVGWLIFMKNKPIEKSSSSQPTTRTSKQLSPQTGSKEDRAHADDVIRQTDINILDSHAEAYWADNGYYPSLTEMNNSHWRETNLRGLDEKVLKDPSGSSEILVSVPKSGVYAYQVSPKECSNSANNNCTSFTLTAIMSTGQPYQKMSH